MRFPRPLKQITAAFALASLTACAGFDGTKPSIDDNGPTSNSATDKDVFKNFHTVWDSSFNATTGAMDDTKAASLAKGGMAVVDANCRQFFDSAGKEQQYILFGEDVLNYINTIGAAAFAATSASSGATTALALGTGDAVGASKLFRQDFFFNLNDKEGVNAVRTLILNDLATLKTSMTTKGGTTGYSVADAINDIKDYQNVCMPSGIVAEVTAALNAAQPSATPSSQSGTQTSQTQQGQTPQAGQPPATSTVAQTPATVDAAHAVVAKNNLLSLKQRMSPQLFKSTSDVLDKIIAKAPAETKTPAFVPTPPAATTLAPSTRFHIRYGNGN